ncbi:YdeI/OmpD-associated family protein [Oricola sp.]|uniref:YdeI/OmpD-associated family protein n=1 Tax=Oricola sp. TaxID=1979950 RepID=UPI0025F4A2BA|nr:YdeI/OmpD-associated family protein [Oricola sp.]MCI5075406.1 YdeI/OmpD-associated family protein [Oricola sp.]
MNAKIDAFFEKDGRWREELRALRAILLDCPVGEEWKWRGPVYTAHDGNIAILHHMKDAAVVGFFKGVLLDDPDGLLRMPGENSRSSRFVKFTSVDEVAQQEAALRALIAGAIANEKAGLKVDFPKDDLPYPAELVDRLDGDPEFRDAFEGLTPGRQRGWVLHFSGAKQSATRVSRIDKAAPKILAGKGMHDR